MKIYDTLTRELRLISPNLVRIYLCGVTVYDNSHIGHARTILVFDVLNRYLRFKGYRTHFVQNFTDLDDKIINRSKTEGLQPHEIANKYIKSYFEDFSLLNVLYAEHYPCATEHIKEMIEIISGLVKGGYGYVSTNGVYFRVNSFPEYGKLSKKSPQELEAGARVEIDQSKEHPLDFALWKFSSEVPTYPSPWGSGRPGWHIECTAMALKYLGNTFEIHGGGNDLIFPHHENEIAQSECYSGEQFAKVWMHVGMVTVNSCKMSKSLGNIITIKEAIRYCGTNSLRLYSLSVQYSKPLDYSEDVLVESIQKWKQIETCVWELKNGAFQGRGTENDLDRIDVLCKQTVESFQAALNDNLDTPLAIKVFMKFVNVINRYVASDKLTRDMRDMVSKHFDDMMNILGLRVIEVTEEERKKIEHLIMLRNTLREQMQFCSSDAIRKQLANEYSVEVMDHVHWTTWKKVESLTK